MKRNVDMNEISDGERYRSGDLVKIGCDGCGGNASCCKNTADTVILDPYDVFQICTETGKSFSVLADEAVFALRLVDGVILPYLNKNESGSCVFLSDGKCGIYDARPGFCRLFPLGRIYENGSFSYFLQIKECPCTHAVKTKVRKWIGIGDIDKYEDYVLAWHNFLEKAGNAITSGSYDEESIKKLEMLILGTFYSKPYAADAGFYGQFYERLSEISGLLR